MATEWRNPRHDLREQSRTVFEQALAISLALMVFTFLAYPSFIRPPREFGAGPGDAMEITMIPQTDQRRMPPAPQRPQTPIATESELIPDYVTIAETSTDVLLPSGGPPLPRIPTGGGAGRVHTTYDEAPIISRMAVPDYPEHLKRAGIEGRVMVSFIVDERGNVVEPEVISSTPPGVFDQLALAAVSQWRFRPARIRDQPVRVRLQWPIEFSLKDF